MHREWFDLSFLCEVDKITTLSRLLEREWVKLAELRQPTEKIIHRVELIDFPLVNGYLQKERLRGQVDFIIDTKLYKYPILFANVTKKTKEVIAKIKALPNLHAECEETHVFTTPSSPVQTQLPDLNLGGVDLGEIEILDLAE